MYYYIIESVNNIFHPNSGTLDQDENLDDNIDDEDTVRTKRTLASKKWIFRKYGRLSNKLKLFFTWPGSPFHESRKTTKSYSSFK